MKRREFVSLVGVSSVVPLAIASCQAQNEQSFTIGPPRSDGFQAIGTIADLNAKGQLLADTAVGKVLVIPDPADQAQAIAVNPACTHAGCIVAWQQNQSAFVCPCHNSRFASSGNVTQGPATQPLPTYVAKLEGDLVWVKVS